MVVGSLYLGTFMHIDCLAIAVAESVLMYRDTPGLSVMSDSNSTRQIDWL